MCMYTCPVFPLAHWSSVAVSPQVVLQIHWVKNTCHWVPVMTCTQCEPCNLEGFSHTCFSDSCLFQSVSALPLLVSASEVNFCWNCWFIADTLWTSPCKDYVHRHTQSYASFVLCYAIYMYQLLRSVTTLCYLNYSLHPLKSYSQFLDLCPRFIPLSLLFF